MSWTDSRVEKLKELWSKGMSASEIADSIGDVSRNAVIGKAHRLGLSTRSKRETKKIILSTPTIISIVDKKCKWPIGDPRDCDFKFCDHLAHESLPYCLEHAAKAYQPVSRKRIMNDAKQIGI